MESIEEIESKLSVYRSQLEQVSQLLLDEPSNEQFLNLKDDLEKVISLTETLARQQYPTQETHQQNQAEDDDQYSLGDAESEGEDGPSKYDSNLQDTDIAKQLLPVKVGQLEVGEHVEVLGGDRPFAAAILEISPNPSSSDELIYKIRYYEFPDTPVLLPSNSAKLERITPGPYNATYNQKHSNLLAVGSKCEAKYATDGKYYDVTITGVTSCGYAISYIQYGTSEEVPLEYLRPSANSSHPSSAFAKKPIGTKSGSTATNDQKKSAIIPIPENLKILPTDTEEEIARKKKKIKAIKNKNRIIAQEEEVAQVQHSWKTFVDKGKKRSLAGITKASMFSSSESTISKVGVTNSGKGMTSYDARKKYKFDS